MREGISNFSENKERGPKKVLIVEPDEEIATLYAMLFTNKRMPIEVVPAKDAVEKRRDNIHLILVEPPRTESIGEYVVKLRRLYPEQHIIIASERKDILTDIKDTKSYPNVSAITKTFHLGELNELVDVLMSPDWEDKIVPDEKLHG